MLSNLSTKPFATALAWIDFRSALNTNYLWVHSAIFYPESQRDKSQVVSVFKRSFRGSLNVEMRWRPAGEGFSELICILYHPSLKDPLRLTSGVFLRYSNKRQGVCDRVDYKKGGWFPWTRKSFAFMEKRPPPAQNHRGWPICICAATVGPAGAGYPRFRDQGRPVSAHRNKMRSTM